MIVRLAVAVILAAALAVPAAAEPIEGLAPGPEFPLPAGFGASTLAADGAGRVFALNADGTRVVVHTTDGAVVGDWPTGIAPQRVTTTAIAASPAGDVFVLAEDERQVRRYTPEGAFAGTVGGSLGVPAAIAAGTSGELVVSTGTGLYVLGAGGEVLHRRADPLAYGLAAGPSATVWTRDLRLGLVARARDGRLVGRIPLGTRSSGPGEPADVGALAVTPARELLALDAGTLQVFGRDRQLRLTCPVISLVAVPGLAVGADGTVLIAAGGAVRPHRRVDGDDGICTPAPFRIARHRISRAGPRAVRVTATIASRRGRADSRVLVEMAREEREACDTGRADRRGACLGTREVVTAPVGRTRRGRTVRRVVRLPGAGSWRVAVVAEDTRRGARVVTRHTGFAAR